MRAILFAAFAMLAACAPREQASCEVRFDREIAFTAPDAADVVTVLALGPSCEQLTGVFTLSDAGGDPLWAWAAPMRPAFGDAFAGADREAVRAFLERWSQPTIARTSESPPWPLTDNLVTTLDQATYEDIRARDLPMLCHFSGTGRQACVFWEPAAAGAGHYFDRDAPEAGSTTP
ncbi:MAG: hypothetical protein NW206_19145 [Hyphomonadaceae bacterium]|nr:hypothetical protein [Hyphomonadaceae bacterium]